MPEAFSAGAASPSSCERSRPRVFFAGTLDFFASARPPIVASSSLRSASTSAFFRACSAFLAASASLEKKRERERQQRGTGKGLVGMCPLPLSRFPSWGGRGGLAHFFALLLAPFCHLSSSAVSRLASSAATFWAAASALRAFPATFLLLSPFLPAMARIVGGNVLDGR